MILTVCLSACMPEQCVGRVPCPLESYMYVIQWRTSATTATHTLKLMQWSTFVLPLVLIHPQCSFMTLLKTALVRVVKTCKSYIQSPIRIFLTGINIIFLGNNKTSRNKSSCLRYLTLFWPVGQQGAAVEHNLSLPQNNPSADTHFYVQLYLQRYVNQRMPQINL